METTAELLVCNLILMLRGEAHPETDESISIRRIKGKNAFRVVLPDGERLRVSVKKSGPGKLRAVAFGEDGTRGDSSFHPGGAEMDFICTGQETFEELLARWKTEFLKHEKQDPTDEAYFEEAEIELPTGFWIVRHRDWSGVEKMLDAADPGSDSALYSVNHAAKATIEAQAIKTVTK